MGLDTSHDCWSGAYSAFNKWRTKICEVSGYGDLKDYHGFGGDKSWLLDEDPLTILLYHSDCDGEIDYKDCDGIADRLTELLPALKIAADGFGHIGLYEEKTQTFIDGLREASKLKENVDFH